MYGYDVFIYINVIYFIMVNLLFVFMENLMGCYLFIFNVDESWL